MFAWSQLTRLTAHVGVIIVPEFILPQTLDAHTYKIPWLISCGQSGELGSGGHDFAYFVYTRRRGKRRNARGIFHKHGRAYARKNWKRVYADTRVIPCRGIFDATRDRSFSFFLFLFSLFWVLAPVNRILRVTFRFLTVAV